MTPSPRRRRSTGRITLTEVAKEASVSPITASRALRGESSVSQELVERVRLAADRLGYIPDPAARALASSRSTSVAVLVPMLSNMVFVDLIEAVNDVLFESGYQALIGITHYDPAQEEVLIRSYLSHRPAGLMVTGFDRTEASRRLIQASGVPCVHLMETTHAPEVYCVGFSQENAGASMTRHLIERGRKKIAYVAAQLDPRTMQRATGYRQVLKAEGLYDAKLEVLCPERSSVSLGARLFGELLQAHPEVDAIFFNNDDLAQGALYAAAAAQISVPEQIAIGGFNNLPAGEQMIPSLTTIDTPRKKIGELAARMVIELAQGKVVPQNSVDVGFELIVRNSS